MVPEGWKLAFPAEIVSLFNGFAFKSIDAVSSGARWLKIANVGVGKLKWDDESYLPKSYIKQYQKFFLEAGEIVVAMTRPTFGRQLKIAKIDSDSDRALLNQRVAKLIVSKGNDRDFTYQLFRTEEMADRINAALLGTDPPNLSASILSDFKILVPPLSEQERIAKILSTWDRAIATIEQLLANSRQQKKALMQQLLTGKKRLLDDNEVRFSSEWVDYKLTSVAEVIVSPVDKKTIKDEVPVELCNYTDVYYNHHITRKLQFMKATAKTSEMKKYTLKLNDVIITKDSETPGDIAVPALVSEDLGGVLCGYHLAIVRPNPEMLSGPFLNYLFSMPETRYYFFTLATGATRFGLSVGGINKAHFKLPSLNEQIAIAKVLSSTDEEVSLLQQKVRDLKQEKKALMQQLLTGKRRVKVNEVVA